MNRRLGLALEEEESFSSLGSLRGLRERLRRFFRSLSLDLLLELSSLRDLADSACLWNTVLEEGAGESRGGT